MATCGGAFFGVAPEVGALGAAVWILVFAIFRYASVASIVAAVSLPLIALGLGEPWPVIAFGSIAALAVILLHRPNISRLRAGTETRFRFRRWTNRDITMWFLSQRFLPPVATVIPIFLMARETGLLDTPLALALVNATFTLPFAVLILRDVFRELPRELEEAALVDGASHLAVFRLIALPLAAPAIVAAGIICFAFSWNEFLFALNLTVKNAVPMTVIIAGSEHTKGVIFAEIATRILVAVVPPAIMAVLVQRYIVRGLTLGAVKG